jgi:hypothetical protein
MKDMKVIYSKHVPFEGYAAMIFFNYIIIREDCKDLIGSRTFRHEAIHQAQAYDFRIGFCGYFVFYLLYLLE